MTRRDTLPRKTKPAKAQDAHRSPSAYSPTPPNQERSHERQGRYQQHFTQLLPFFRSLIRHPYPHALGSSSP